MSDPLPLIDLLGRGQTWENQEEKGYHYRPEHDWVLFQTGQAFTHTHHWFEDTRQGEFGQRIFWN
jgi:hypothetical protein